MAENDSPEKTSPNNAIASWAGLMLVIVALVEYPLYLLAADFGGDRFRWFTAGSGTVAALIGLAAVASATWLGWKSAWESPAHLRRSWMIGPAIAIVLTIVLVVSHARAKEHRGRMEHAVMAQLRLISAAADQYFLEHPHRLFLRYEDLVGPENYVKQLTSVTGEEYRALFPVGRPETEDLRITLPWHSEILHHSEYFATRPRDGVWSFKDPLSDTRLEFTYRDGVRDGPVRAFDEKGELWGETAYTHGRVTGPSWIHLPDGKKVDELQSPPPVPAKP